MVLNKSLHAAIITHWDFSQNVFDFTLTASADWLLPSVAVCIVFLIAKAWRK